jgi:hypothetical protein
MSNPRFAGRGLPTDPPNKRDREQMNRFITSDSFKNPKR